MAKKIKKKKDSKKGKKSSKLPTYLIPMGSEGKNRLRVSIRTMKDDRSGDPRSFLDIRVDFNTVGTKYKQPSGVKNDPVFANGWAPSKRGITIGDPEVVDAFCDIVAEKGERLVAALKKLKG